MRIRHSEPKLLQLRRKARWLIFPKTIGEETRWLERACWEEIYEEVYEEFWGEIFPVRRWTPIHWAN